MPAEYATWDPAAKGTEIILSEADLKAAKVTGSWNHVRATLGKPISEGGKWYWETTVVTGAGPSQMAGLANADAFLGSSSHGYLGLSDDSVGIWGPTSGRLEFFGASSSALTCDPWIAGDILGHELDLDADTYRMSVNNVWSAYLLRGFPSIIAGNYSGSPQLIYPAFAMAGANSVIANFGESAFTYTPPDGANHGWYVGEDGGSGVRRRKVGQDMQLRRRR